MLRDKTRNIRLESDINTDWETAQCQNNYILNNAYACFLIERFGFCCQPTWLSTSSPWSSLFWRSTLSSSSGVSVKWRLTLSCIQSTPWSSLLFRLTPILKNTLKTQGYPIPTVFSSHYNALSISYRLSVKQKLLYFARSILTVIHCLTRII